MIKACFKYFGSFALLQKGKTKSLKSFIQYVVNYLKIIFLIRKQYKVVLLSPPADHLDNQINI